MKKTICIIALGCWFGIGCTSEETYNKEPLSENVMEQRDLYNLINRLTSKSTSVQHKQSLQQLILQIEATALEDPDFEALVDENYTTPLAADIEALLNDADAVLAGLDIKTLVKSYVHSVLSTTTTTGLATLCQTVGVDTSLTTDEKAMLIDVTELRTTQLLGNGEDDDWDTKEIIGYVQGYTQSKANAVLNVVIIEVLRAG